MRLNSTVTLYLCVLVMFLMMAQMKSIHFEPIEIDKITRIIHPEYPKGGLSYDPLWHYDYIVAFVAESFGYKDNFKELAGLFWFLENGFTVLVLILLSNYLFKNDKMTLVIVVFTYLLFKSGETDQKTMARPLHLLAIYFFLREKWLISAAFAASLFYLHVGIAVWWVLPSSFALAIIKFTKKRVNLKQMMNYSFVIITLASPVLYFYSTRSNATLDEFSIEYFYYCCWYTLSVILTLTNQPIVLMSEILMVMILLVGYRNAKKLDNNVDNIMPILFGVLILYFFSFIFADLLRHGSIMRLQFLRSILNVELFSMLFFAFLLSRQIKKGNYLFFLIFLFLFMYSHIWSRFLGNINRTIALNTFYAVMLLYEIFELYILNFIKGIYKNIESKFNLGCLNRVASKCNRILQRPLAIVIIMLFPIFPMIKPVKSYIKSVVGIHQPNATVVMTPMDYLHNDIARFTNEKITDKHALLLHPFDQVDFVFYTNHNTFIDINTPIYLNDKNFRYFRHVLENDLNYSLEKIYDIENFSPNNSRKSWRIIWEKLDENVIKKWKMNYNLTHVIRENNLPLNFPILYQNKVYTVYEIN